MFRNWFSMHSSCSNCGHVYERERDTTATASVSTLLENVDQASDLKEMVEKAEAAGIA